MPNCPIYHRKMANRFRMRQLQQKNTALAMTLRVGAALVVLLFACHVTRAQGYRFGLSTNLAYDATWLPHYGWTSIPSGSLEVYPAQGHWTFGADVEWPMWHHEDTHRYLQMNHVTLWSRRYFQPADFSSYRKWYLLGSVNASRFGLGLDTKKGWQGEGLGASIGGGYKVSLGKHFTLDFGLALGVYYAGYDPYVWGDDATGWYYYDYDGDPAAFQKRNQRFFWAGPTRIYLNIGFDFWSRKRSGRSDSQ